MILWNIKKGDVNYSSETFLSEFVILLKLAFVLPTLHIQKRTTKLYFLQHPLPYVSCKQPPDKRRSYLLHPERRIYVFQCMFNISRGELKIGSLHTRVRIKNSSLSSGAVFSRITFLMRPGRPAEEKLRAGGISVSAYSSNVSRPLVRTLEQHIDQVDKSQRNNTSLSTPCLAYLLGYVTDTHVSRLGTLTGWSLGSFQFRVCVSFVAESFTGKIHYFCYRLFMFLDR